MGNCVFECKNGHFGLVTALIPLYDDSRIATCSEDGHIRIWGSASHFQLPPVFKVDPKPGLAKNQGKSSVSQKETLLVRRDPSEPLQAKELGDMVVHSDGIIVLWKDDRIEKEFRNFEAYNNLRAHNVSGF